MEAIEMLSRLTRRNVLGLIGAAVLVFILIQFIPVDKTNPSVVAEPNWDSPQTRELAKVACFDCHSNETLWPWYAKIAPSSWLLYRDVTSGRERLNFSEWGTGRPRELGEMAEAINGGSMPPWYYTIMHPNAKLSDSEKQALILGLQASLASSSGQATPNGSSLVDEPETENDD
jgi:mono/diheme cytochrome c family protein